MRKNNLLSSLVQSACLCAAFFVSVSLSAQCSIVNQTVSAAQSSICSGASGQVQLASSQAGVTYKLRNDANDAVVGSAVTGTGSALTFNTGALTATTSFNVFAEYASYGIQFDGSNDNIVINNPVNTASFTLEAWIKTSVASFTGTNAFEGSGLLYADVGGGANDYTFALVNNKLSFFDGGNNINVSGTTNLNDGNWHHVAVIRTAGVKNRLYVDGVFQSEANASSAILNARAQMVIGGNTGDNRYFNGTMDEVRVWNYAMDPAVLAANMYTCYTGTETGIRALFKFENGPNSATATNSIGSNNGTLVNTNNATVWTSGTNICAGCNLEMSNVVTITVGSVPSAPTGTAAQTFCTGQTVSSLVATGTSIQWYAASSGGSALSGSTALVNNTTYYATQTVNGCESTSRFAVTATVNAAPSAPGQSATGGNITTSGGYKIHTFTSSGTFVVPAGMSGVNAEVLVVAGGGGGGNRHAGGGGAGGVVYNNAFALTAGQSYTVTVGAGGTGANGGMARGNNGGNSVFSTITATGGGGGGSNNQVGGAGGSGGGGSNGTNGGNGTAGQGNKGGNQNNGAGCCHAWGCGGGGAGAAGANSTGSTGSAGGVGVQYSISGSPVFYAGGGGGGNGSVATVLAGGSGGGGNGGSNNTLPTAGAANTGGGGGGGGANGVSSEAGAAGGSGVVIIRYLDSGSASLNQTFCGATTVANLTMTGSNIKWYATSTGGTPLQATDVVTTGTYYASQTVGSCESARTTVNVTVNTPITYYLDADNDGYYVSTTIACSSPGASYRTTGSTLGDCNDNNASVFGAAETCNGLDDDCDGSIDEGLTTAYFVDADLDGYGAGSSTAYCTNPGAGYSLLGGDCNDANLNIYPTAIELCNGIDDNCANGADDGLTFLDYYYDGDNDNYGTLDSPSQGLAGSLLTGLQYYVPMDGSFTDISGNNAVVNNQGGATFGTDRLNQTSGAGNFGSNQRLMSMLNVSETSFSVSLFFKTTNSNAGFFAVSGGGHDRHIHLTGGNIRVRLWANEALQTTGLNLADNQWHHVVYQYQQGVHVQKVYVDGNLVLTGTRTFSDFGTQDRIYVGYSEDAGYINSGSMDDVAIWTRVLTLAEIQSLYNGTSGGNTYPVNACADPGSNYAPNTLDCDDDNVSINPDVVEICNAIDDDCDGTADDGLTFVNYYVDADGDGYGAGAASNLCSNPGSGYVTNNTDCNDADATLNSISTEVCNNFDDDCDGTADDGLTFVNYYVDADGDGYGAGAASNLCSNPGAGYVTNNTDCNDANATLNSITTEVCNNFDDDCDGTNDNGLTFIDYYVDSDGDGYGAGVASNLCSDPGAGYVTNNTDCNDEDALLNSISAETCNNFDDDCDGEVDEYVTTTFYQDTDGDGFGDLNVSTEACSSPAGFVLDNSDCDDASVTYQDGDNDGYGSSLVVSCGVENNTDCNDADATLNSINTEVCNNFDDDCDGTADDGLTFVNYYVDADGDGYGAGAASNLCSNPGAGYVTNNTDCNDADAALNSITTEVCNNFDDDCNGEVDNDLIFVDYYVDADGDGYGAGAASNLCSNPGAGYVTNNTDCNDADATLNSITTEVCNNFDDDCDGTADDGLTFVNYYVDTDGDGFGAGAASNLCSNPGAGYVTNNTDCNDADATLNAITTEVCNNFDDDCDGTSDDGLTFVNYYADADGDGYGAGAASNLCSNPGAGYVTNNTDCNDADAALNSITTEVCNNFDDDCNGEVDNDLIFVDYFVDADGDGYGAGAASNLCSNPGAGYVTNNTDCNDADATLNSINTEVCNNFDDDCNGVVDNDLIFVDYFVDADGDGFGAGAASNLCSNPGAGFVTNNTDCNDADAALNSISTEVCNNFDDDCNGEVDNDLIFVDYFVDADGDGYGAGAASNLCSNPGAGFVTNNTDCNDADAALNSITTEVCNNFDDDCNGEVDNDLIFVDYFADADGDGYGAGAASNLCSNPGAGYVTNNTDCNNNNATVHAITTEVCNNFDDDCDGTADDGLTFVNYYADTDGDGYGAGAASNLCSNPGAGYVTNNTDCNNNNATVHAITTEVCNNFDDDCDGTADDGLTFVNYYVDTDGDGYGAGAASNLCSNPGAGFVTNNTDCNNNNATVHAITTEVCNNFDDDCDGTADDGLTFVNYYADTDGDGYGAGAASNLCSNPGVGYVTNNTDCNDADATLNAITTEVCNNFDDDCDGTADDGLTFVNYYVDTDGDGYGAGAASNLCSNPGLGYATNNNDCDDAVSTTNPGATESCNDVDDDCNGVIDNNIVFTNYFADNDGDGYGTGAANNSCSNPGAGYVTNNTDCNDADATLNAITTEVCNNFDDDCNGVVDNDLIFVDYFVDADGDGFGAGAASNLCSNPGAGFVTNNTDCNDADAALNSITTEVCNNFDDDCNGEVDNDLIFVDYFVDADGDGYGAGAASNLCSDPGAGYVTNNTDCNDADATLNSITTEVCNNFDDDCNGVVDNDLIFVDYFVDADGDGYGAGAASNLCSNPGAGFVTNNTDCNDADATLNAITTEVCNNFDDDCNGEVDNDLIFVDYFVDADGDGYGAGAASNLCSDPGLGYSTSNIDCDDNVATTYPSALEACNDVDDDCNGVVDNDIVFTNYYVDNDADGFGYGDATSSCSNPGEGFTTDNSDCNDTDGNIFPTATEVCNYIDDNCNDLTDEGVTTTYYEDLDADGYGNIDVTIDECGLISGYAENGLDCVDEDASVNPSVSEICNLIDDNCDGEADEFVTTTYFADNDGDGFGFADNTVQSCEQPQGFVTNSDDCDDSAITYEDLDGDGYGNVNIVACGVLTSDDCDDTSASINPGANEVCDNGTDDNCDGEETTCIFLGCTDVAACNFNATANTDDGSCTYPAQSYLNCDGTCINDTDADGVCNEIEVAGCTDATACNYDSNATDENGSCTYPAQSYLNCNGTCINDTDADGVCNEIEVVGCTDVTACNYDASATDENGSCTYPAQPYLNCDGTCINDTDADGVCNEIEVAGCKDATACNYDSNATDENGSCTYPAQTYLNCDGTCINDTDTDGVCNEIEVVGCTDVTACNYDASATDENGSCTYPAQPYLNCDGTCINDTDADGVCNEIEVAGCKDATACNYDSNATDENGSCTYPAQTYLNCDGTCINDTDTDGVCNEIEVVGCTDETACNYIVNATEEDGTCTYPAQSYLNCDGTCINDTDADGVCNEIEVAGCTDATACNYDSNATDDDGSCILPVAEICNTLDDDCDGEVDEFVTTIYYADLDQDGFGDVNNTIVSCSAPNGFTTDTSDCDDSAITYLDEDGDGFGINQIVPCGVTLNTDCDDTNSSIYPGVNEQCNLIDDNCDGITDNNVVYVNYYADADSDGFGNSGLSVLACVQPVGYINNNDDCNDADSLINPNAIEIEGNDIDENCDGQLVGLVEMMELSIAIYPNPTRGNVQLNWGRSQDVTIRVLDAQGRLVLSEVLYDSKSTNINLEGFESGMYIVQWIGNEVHRSMTIIKE